MKFVKNQNLLKWVKYLPILPIIQLFSFNLSAQSKHLLPAGIKIVDLPDRYFAYKNLSSSLALKKFCIGKPDKEDDWYDREYKDSTKKFELYQLTHNQR